MDSRDVVNLICLIVGVGAFICGVMIRAGMIPQTVPARGLVPMILGIIIVVWNGYSLVKHRKR